MQISYFPYSEVAQLSHTDADFIADDPKLRAFVKHDRSLYAFGEVIAAKEKNYKYREVLYQSLCNQNKDLMQTDFLLSKQIDSLRSNDTFCITTAHQPIIALGPMYILYKVASVINLCNQLKTKYPQKHFVPIFVIGGEDHDVEEIEKIELFGKQLKWETSQKGAVGRFTLDSIDDFSTKLFDLANHDSDITHIFDFAYKNSDNKYSNFFKLLLYQIFSKHGLVIVDMDRPELKICFKDIILKDLLYHLPQKEVVSTQNKLESLGYKKQAFARVINLFYLSQNNRTRITRDGDFYQFGSHKIHISQLEQFVTDHIANISPNVILRPLYQELILPNLAYIGGGGEIAYWIERKSLFDLFEIAFPMLLRRNSALILPHKITNKISALGLQFQDFFLREEELTHKYLNLSNHSQFDIGQFASSISSVFDQIRQSVTDIDQTLVSTIESEKTKTVKSLDTIKSKVQRSIKRQNESMLQSVLNIQLQILPHRNLQERIQNFVPFYLKTKSAGIDYLVEQLDPFDHRFVVVEY